MTRNLYLGSDLVPVVSAQTIDELPTLAGQVLTNVLASEPVARMALVADEIAAVRPDVIGLQEAVIFRAQIPSDFDFAAPVRNAGDPGAPGAIQTIDLLDTLQS